MQHFPSVVIEKKKRQREENYATTAIFLSLT